jgi:hemerythrin-like metal-binding protein
MPAVRRPCLPSSIPRPAQHSLGSPHWSAARGRASARRAVGARGPRPRAQGAPATRRKDARSLQALSGAQQLLENTMAFIEWNDSLVVGHPKIDEDHKRLVALVCRLYEAMQAGKGNAVCGQILGDLIAYTKTHFAMEEGLMAAAGYPKLAEHRAQHNQLVHDVMDFKARLDGGSTALTIGLFKFLKDWLANHIGASDKQLVEALRRK